VRVAFVIAAFMLAGCGGATSPGTVDLLEAASPRLVGATVDAWAGTSVADAGDVNGDGRPDVLVGAPRTNTATLSQPGTAYVVFGGSRASDLGRVATDGAGLVLVGASASDHAGTAVAAAGDVNGDGLADVAVGAPDAGAAYVVFGRKPAGAIELGRLEAAGYRIAGAVEGSETGFALASAGDVNGDGRPDLLVGAPGANAAYVVFGRAAPGTVDLRHLGGGGFRIDGAASGDATGSSVSGLGDANGDGRSDLLIGAPDASGGAGSAFVVYSPRNPRTIDLARLGRQGVRIDGERPGDVAGTAVAGTTSTPPELLIGAPYAPVNGLAAGAAYVLRAPRCCATVSLSRLEDRGYRLDGAAPLDRAGSAVAFAGDLNHDGCPELLIGAPKHGFGDRGAAYLVLGSRTPAGERLGDNASRELRIDGALSFDAAGASVAALGDRVVVGAQRAYHELVPESGAAYLVAAPASLRSAPPGAGCRR
jgi:hypothetical protein